MVKKQKSIGEFTQVRNNKKVLISAHNRSYDIKPVLNKKQRERVKQGKSVNIDGGFPKSWHKLSNKEILEINEVVWSNSKWCELSNEIEDIKQTEDSLRYFLVNESKELSLKKKKPIQADWRKVASLLKEKQKECDNLTTKLQYERLDEMNKNAFLSFKDSSKVVDKSLESFKTGEKQKGILGFAGISEKMLDQGSTAKEQKSMKKLTEFGKPKKDLGINQKKVIKLIKTNPESTIAWISAQTKLSEKQVKNSVERLKEKEILKSKYHPKASVNSYSYNKDEKDMKTKNLNTTFEIKGKEGVYEIYNLKSGMDDIWTSSGFKKKKVYAVDILTPHKTREDGQFTAENIEQLKKKIKKWKKEYETFM